jgi:alpha-glucosidase
MMRPLFLEFPDSTVDRQPIDLANGNSFLLGPDLLVAENPYPDEVGDYTVELPSVGWYDYWTGARAEGIAGGKDITLTEKAGIGVTIHPSLKTLPVFVRAGAIVPEQPLVQSTDETPQGALTLRVYPPTTANEDCRGSLYLDDGVSYNFQKGEFLRVGFTCRQTAAGLSVTVTRREGSFMPWWKQLSIEVYGAGKPAAAVSATNQGNVIPVTTGFDAKHHRITSLVSDDGKGLEMKLAY